jgi:hypothetical protein
MSLWLADVDRAPYLLCGMFRSLIPEDDTL